MNANKKSMTSFYAAEYGPKAFDVSHMMEEFSLSEAEATSIVEEMRADKVFKNDTYQVAARRLKSKEDRNMPAMLHLSIKRIDRKPIHDWRDLQQIKNEFVGEECEAVEIYPAESRLVDTANQYHLWCFMDPAQRIPFGFGERFVHKVSMGSAQQRAFDSMRQERRPIDADEPFTVGERNLLRRALGYYAKEQDRIAHEEHRPQWERDEAKDGADAADRMREKLLFRKYFD